MNEIKTSKLWGHFVGYFLCFVLAGLIAAIPRFIIGFENESGLIVFISEMIRIPVSIAVLYFYTKYIAQIPINKETLSFENFSLLKWALVGILMPALVMLIFYFSGNLEVLQTNFTLDQSIIIDNVLKIDEGIYICKITNLSIKNFELFTYPIKINVVSPEKFKLHDN